MDFLDGFHVCHACSHRKYRRDELFYKNEMVVWWNRHCQRFKPLTIGLKKSKLQNTQPNLSSKHLIQFIMIHWRTG